MLLAGGLIRPTSALTIINPTPSLTLSGSSSISIPVGVLVDGADVWVADQAGHVYEYPAPYSAGEAPIVTLTVSVPWGLAVDSSGNLWVSSLGSGKVVEFAAPIVSGASPAITLSGLGQPYGITINDGNLWVATYSDNYVYEYSPLPTSNMASPPTPVGLTGLDQPLDVALDSSGNLWVANYAAGQVVEYASPVHSGEGPSATLTPPGSPSEVSSVIFDGAGNLWVGVPRNAGQVAEFTAPLTNGETGTTQISISSGDSVWGLSIDASGDVWVADFIDGSVYEFNGLASPFTAPFPTHFPTLPAVIPSKFTFNFKNSSSIVGKEVSLWGSGVIYNLPGFNAKVDFYPYAVNICSNAGNSTVSIYGYFQTGQGHNATELYVFNWSSINTPSAGWPSEPACKA